MGIRTVALIFTMMLVGCRRSHDDPSLANLPVGIDPTAVSLQLTTGYKNPTLHRLRVVGSTPQAMIQWGRQYDGIDMAVGATSARVGDHWELRYIRELQEPERPRPDDILAPGLAIKRSGFTDKLSSEPRLVYKPKFKQLALKAVVQNAMDVERVVANYQLVYEVLGAQSWVSIDAYTGAIVDCGGNFIPQVPVEAPCARSQAN